VATIPFDIKASNEFLISWKKLSYKVGVRAPEFEQKIKSALDLIREKGPGFSQSHGDALKQKGSHRRERIDYQQSAAEKG
jgi:hypothetical protein